MFIVFLAATILCWIAPSDYLQAAQRSYRIGILIPESGPGEVSTLKGFRDELRNIGYVEGENLTLELRDLKGDRSVLTTQAADLVSRKVNVIFTTGSRATEAAKAATQQIPIVFRHPADPVELGLLKNAKRPEGNVTGVAGFSSDMNQKRLEVLKAIVPNLGRVHVFYDSNNKYSTANLSPLQKAADKLQLEVAAHGIKNADELKTSLEKMAARNGDAIFQIADELVESNASLLFEVAKKLRLPTIFDQESWAIRGSLASYGPSYAQMGRQAAGIVDKLLKGAKPKDVPVQAANKSDLVINLRIANIIGLNIPSEALKKADRVIH